MIDAKELRSNGIPGSCDVFVAMTHYQILVATALAMWRDRPAKLYVLTDYLDMDRELSDHIRSTGVFISVTFFSERLSVAAFYRELELGAYTRPEDIAAALRRNFDPLYSRVFKGCSARDLCFVFNEMQHYYYYIEQLFDQLVKVEDGYKSFPQELTVHRLGGKRHVLHKIEGRGFPVLKTRSPKLSAIVVSEPSESIPEEYRDKLTVLDIRKLFDRLGGPFADAAMRMFALDRLAIPERSVLVLTQPLARAGYCTRRQQYELYDALCRKHEQDDAVFLKPHPADKVDYAGLERRGVKILDKGFPIDVLEFTDIQFRLGVTFGSTALRDAKYVRQAEYLFNKDPFTSEDVTAAITDYTKTSSVSIAYCVDCVEATSKQVSETLVSLAAMDLSPTAEILLMMGSAPLDPPLPTRIHASLVHCNPSDSALERKRKALRAVRSEYVLLTTAGFAVSRRTHLEVSQTLERSNYDCVHIGLRQTFENQEISSRYFYDIPLDIQPYFFQNKFFRRDLLEQAIGATTGVSDDIADLCFYLEVVTLCASDKGVLTASAQFSSESSLTLNWPMNYRHYSFAQQLRVCSHIDERSQSAPTSQQKAYHTTLIGFIFWLMRWACQPLDLKYQYTDFLESKMVVALTTQALSLAMDRSRYAKGNLGGSENASYVNRMKRMSSVLKREGIRRILGRLRSKGFRRKALRFARYGKS
ncbi:MAG: glycosyltransferase family 52 protein [Propionibacteriaceae bacterium]|nr:glycosyltransferase family 52 protein [Propionibacteriaceae bacterium]